LTVRVRREPWRHLLEENGGADGFRPRPRIAVSQQRKRADFAGPVTLLAVSFEQRFDVLVKGHVPVLRTRSGKYSGGERKAARKKTNHGFSWVSTDAGNDLNLAEPGPAASSACVYLYRIELTWTRRVRLSWKHGFSPGRRLSSARGSGRGHRSTLSRRGGRRKAPGSARRHRVGQDLHHGQGD